MGNSKDLLILLSEEVAVTGCLALDTVPTKFMSLPAPQNVMCSGNRVIAGVISSEDVMME